jgi:hypothetical protein
MNNPVKLLSIFIFALTFSCTVRNSYRTGNFVQDQKNITGVTRLHLDGVFNLTLIQSDQESIEVEGDQALLDKLIIDQQGDLLTLEMEEGIDFNLFNDDELRITLHLKELTELNYEGVGNVKTNQTFRVKELKLLGNGVGNLVLDLEADLLHADFDMVGNIELRGSATKVFFTNDGIGKLDASQLIVQDMEIKSSGIGKVALHCEGNLSLTVDGIGKVSYTGNPTLVRKEVSGIGKVEEN